MKSDKMSISKKQEIVERAKKIINEKGINNVTVRDIVKTVGMAQGLFYYYFKSKDEVINVIIDEYVEKFCSNLEEDIANITLEYDDWKEKIETAILMLVELYKDNKSPLEKFNNTKNKELYMSMVYASVDRMANVIEKIINEAMDNNFINISNPQETVYVLIYGIIDLINHKKIVDERIFVNIVFQILGIK